MSMLLAIMGIGTTELMVVMAVMLLLFGHRLPSVMRSLGRGVVEFKRGVAGVDDVEEDSKNSVS